MNVALARQMPQTSPHWKQKQESQKKWAHIWFGKLCQFHKVDMDDRWNFSAKQIIAFLKTRVQLGDPAWKRLKVVEALILFRKLHPVADAECCALSG